MTPATISTPFPAPQRRPSKLVSAVEALLERGAALMHALNTFLNTAPEPTTQKGQNLHRRLFNRLDRMFRALQWAALLAMTLAGEYDPDYKPRAKPASPSAKSPIPARKPRPTTAKNTLAYFRRKLATQPLGKLIAQLCLDFGIKPNSEEWPANLVAIRLTAIEAAKQPAPEPEPAPKPEPEPEPEPQPKPVYEDIQQESPFLKERTKELLTPDTS